MTASLWLGALLLSSPSPASSAAGDLYPQRSTAPIVIVYPSEGLAIPPSEGEFIMGSVSEPAAPFRINGTTVSVHPNGAFLAWLPVLPGTFTFRCELELRAGTTSLARAIYVAAPPQALPEKPLAVDSESVWPKPDLTLRPGDWLAFRMRASPGHGARCRLGKRPWQDLRETAPGTYEAAQAVLPGDEAAPAPVECALKDGWSPPRALSRGQVTLTSAPPLAGVVRNPAVLRTAPGAGYMAYPPAGTRLAVTGRQGSELRVSLSPSLEGWIDAKDVDLQPAGAPTPRATVDAIHTYAIERGASVRIGLTERVAFTVTPDESDPAAVVLRLYNSSGHTNWIVYDSNDSFVREVRWRQEETGVVAVLIRLDPAQGLWGWQASFEGSALKLDLRRAPALAPAPANPLKGVTVMLDPGHMPSAVGAVGPLGTREMDANFAIAQAAAAELSRRGAVPALTRASNEAEVGLSERPRLAVERKADVFISLHNNAIGDGENPFSRPRGFSVFYHHPQSLALAEKVYRAYEKAVPLPGEELRYGNLLVARLTAMPAILVENAYMILPAQEEKLNDPAFRARLAEGVADGLESFLAGERTKQAAAASKRTPSPKAQSVLHSPEGMRKVKATKPAKAGKASRKSKAAAKAPGPTEVDEVLSDAPEQKQ